MNILIVKLSSMGDVVHALPIVADLHRHVPGVRIDWVVEGPFREVCAMNPAIENVLPIALRRWRREGLLKVSVRQEVRRFLRLLRERRYDLVIDCQGLIKSALVARLARGCRVAGLDAQSIRERPADWLYGERYSVPTSWHVVQRNRALVAQAVGYAVDGPAQFGIVPPPPSDVVSTLLPGTPFVVLIPGASRDAKLWPEQDWVELACLTAAHGLSLVWLWGSKAEAERVRRLADAVKSASGTQIATEPLAQVSGAPSSACVAVTQVSTLSKTPVDSTCPIQVIPPFLSIADATAVTARAVAAVGLDTGFTHLAGAIGRNTVGIFCDFDAVQCAVSGPGACTSLGGVGAQPSLREVRDALNEALCATPAHRPQPPVMSSGSLLNPLALPPNRSQGTRLRTHGDAVQ